MCEMPAQHFGSALIARPINKFPLCIQYMHEMANDTLRFTQRFVSAMKIANDILRRHILFKLLTELFLLAHPKAPKYLFSFEWSIILWLQHATSLISRKTGLQRAMSFIRLCVSSQFCMCTMCICVWHFVLRIYSVTHAECGHCQPTCQSIYYKIRSITKVLFPFILVIRTIVPYKPHLMNYLNSLSALVGNAARWFLPISLSLALSSSSCRHREWMKEERSVCVPKQCAENISNR